MLLKILLLIAAIWLVVAVVSFLFKGLVFFGIIALILFGATSAWAWVKRQA